MHAVCAQIREEYERLYGVSLMIRRLSNAAGHTVNEFDQVRYQLDERGAINVVVESWSDTRPLADRVSLMLKGLGRVNAQPIHNALNAVVARCGKDAVSCQRPWCNRASTSVA